MRFAWNINLSELHKLQQDQLEEEKRIEAARLEAERLAEMATRKAAENPHPEIPETPAPPPPEIANTDLKKLDSKKTEESKTVPALTLKERLTRSALLMLARIPNKDPNWLLPAMIGINIKEEFEQQEQGIDLVKMDAAQETPAQEDLSGADQPRDEDVEAQRMADLLPSQTNDTEPTSFETPATPSLEETTPANPVSDPKSEQINKRKPFRRWLKKVFGGKKEEEEDNGNG